MRWAASTARRLGVDVGNLLILVDGLSAFCLFAERYTATSSLPRPRTLGLLPSILSTGIRPHGRSAIRAVYITCVGACLITDSIAHTANFWCCVYNSWIDFTVIHHTGTPICRLDFRNDVTLPMITRCSIRTRITFDDRSFTVAGPRLWNSLPATLRQINSYGQFRRHVKTHLFRA